MSRITPFHAALVALVLFLLAGVLCLATFTEITGLLQEGLRGYDIYRLSGYLRQTSEDLTSMARLHVVTGVPRYRDYFEEILAIRNGESPYPGNYVTQPYWDLVLATGERPGELTETYTLEELVTAFNVPDETAALLYEAERHSNDLVALEREAMEVVAAYVEAGGDFSVVEREVLAAMQSLHGQEYFEAKARIMTSLVEFARVTDRSVQRLGISSSQRIRNLFTALAISTILGILSAAVSVLLARRGNTPTPGSA